MEAVGPIHLLYVLYSAPDRYHLLSTLPTWNKVAAALYIIHYINRAFINPLFVAPSISPIQADLVTFATIFNWMNTVDLGGWIVGYDTQFKIPDWLSGGAEGRVVQQGPPINPGTINTGSIFDTARSFIPYLGIGLFALGMANNIRGERTLWRLRREEADRRASKKDDHANNHANSQSSSNNNSKETAGRYSKVYIIPPAQGLFKNILYPHYVYEWLEWFGFVLVGTAVSAVPVRGTSTKSNTVLTLTTSPIPIAPWFVPFAKLAEWLRVPLPLSALVFVVNDVVTMFPQARRGLQWYKQKFGREAVAGRSAVIPGVSFF